MAVVEREFSSITIDGETSAASIEFNDAGPMLILALILRGDISRRTVIAARGTGSGQANGIANAPFVRLELASQGLNMVIDDEGDIVTPPGFIGVAQWVRPGS